MKKYIVSVVLAVFALASTAMAANTPVSAYGQLWTGVTTSALTVDQAVLGVNAGLGGATSANLAYDAQNNALYTAKVGYAGLLTGTDNLSVGLQASAYDSLLDATLGQSAFNCYGCVHAKSAIYSVSSGGNLLALQTNEHNNYAASLQVPVLPGLLSLVGSANYDNPSTSWIEQGAAQVTLGVVSAVGDCTYANSSWDYGVAAKAGVYQNLGLIGKLRKGGAALVGPTYQASKHLQVGVVGSHAAAGQDLSYQALISANF